MGVKETTYTVKIDTEIADLKQKVTIAKQALDGLLKSGNAPKGLIAAFERIDGLLGRISDQAKMAPSKGMFSGLEKDVGKAGLAFGDLIRHIEALGEMGQEIKLELFPPEERAKIEAAIKGLTEYGKALVEIAEKEKALEKARKASEGATGAAKKAKQEKAAIKQKRDRQVARREGKQAEIATLDPEKDATKIARLQTEIAELDIVIKGLNKDLSAASTALTEANKTAASAAEAYEELSGELAGIKTDKLKEMRAAAAAAGVSIEEIEGEDAVETMRRLSAAMQSFSEGALAGLPGNVDDANEALKKSTSAFNDMTDSVRDAADAHAEFSEQQSKAQDVQKRIKDFLGLAGATKVLSASFRKAFEATKELDAAMTEIAVVTDFNISDMWEQLPEYTKRANELGISITEAYNASALFYQQGLKTNEVVELSNETLKMAKIAGLDAAEATDRMTAALRGFNMELDAASAQKISDVYSKLAAITASDVDEISTAMTKTASIASSAGMEFETTAAFLSQIIETTRESAETAGTAMKTVIARFQELKKAPDEIGEIDGEIVDANAIEGALRSVGVSLRDASGQFRELDDVFLELSSKWDGLDKNTQRYIATIAAGSRQQSRFIAMMQDYERTQELVTAANSSAGASAKQYEKTMESLETKLTQLENAWNEFSTSLLNNEAIKMGVDLLTMFITSINKATSAFDGLLGSVSKIGMILALFRVAKAIFNQFSQKITAMFTSAGEKIGQGIVTGMNKTKKDVINAATSVGRETSEAARSGAEEASAPTASTPTVGATEGAGAPQELTRGQKIGRIVGKVAFAPINAGKWVSKKVSEGNKAMAKKVLSLGQGGQEMMDAEMAGGYAQHGAEQRTKASEAFAGAEVGAAVSGIKGIGKEMNALALPLDEIGKQYQAQMEAMGQSPEEVAEKWAEMRAEFEEGTVSAKEALATIDASLGEAKPGEKLKMTEGMQTESAERAVGPVEMTSDVKEYMAASRADQGLTAIAGAEEGASLSGTLASTELGGEMAATELPLSEIEAQYKEKMTAMNVSTDEVTASWQELYSTITSGQSTASEALDAINQKMDEAAQKALEAQQAAGGGADPTAAMTSASAGITVTEGMKTKASTGAYRAKEKISGASEDTKKKAKAAEQQKKNQKQEKKVASRQQENTEKAIEGQKKMVEAYKETGESIANMGAGLSVAAAGVSALGSKFEEAGYDKTAEVFNTMGQVLGGVGSAMSIVGSVMSFLTPLMSALTASTTAETAATGAQTVATGAQTAGFWAEAAAALGLQAACWPLLLITLAIVAAVLILVAIIWAVTAAFDAMAKASPEGQLKAAEEAAAAAAETAEQAAEAYQEIVEAFEDLDGKYKVLEELTEGTKEWNDAVREINNSVLDLIAKYPELAKLVKNENGVLTLDVNSDEAQAIIKQAEGTMIAAKATSIMANNNVIEKQNEVIYSEAKNTTGVTTTQSYVGGKEGLNNLAKAIADGTVIEDNGGFRTDLTTEQLNEKYGITVEQLNTVNKKLEEYGYNIKDVTKELRNYGHALQEGAEVMSTSMEAIASSVEGIYDFTGWSDSEVENAKEIFDGDVYASIYSQYSDLISKGIHQDRTSDSSQDLDKAIKDNVDAADQKYVYSAIEAKYGQGYKFEKGTIVDSEGDSHQITQTEAQEILQTAAHLKAQEASKVAIAATREVVPALNEAFGKDENGEITNQGIATRLFTDGGNALTGADLAVLQDSEKGYFKEGKLDSSKIGELWTALGEGAQKAFQTQEIFEKRMREMEPILKKNTELNDAIADLVGDSVLTGEGFNKLTIGVKEGIINKIDEIDELMQLRGVELTKDSSDNPLKFIANSLITQIEALPQHLQEMLSAQLASLDVDDADALLGFKYDLVNIYGLEEEAATSLVTAIGNAALATSDWNTKLTTFTAAYAAQKDLEATQKRITELQWKYNEALEDGALILEDGVKTASKILQQQLAEMLSIPDKTAAAYKTTMQDMAKVYANGAFLDDNKVDYRELATIGQDGSVTVDQAKVSELEKGKKIDMEAFTSWVEQLEDMSSTLEDQREAAKENLEAIKELRETTKEGYEELRDTAKEAVLNKVQEQIDIQSATLEATREASSNLINGLQELVNKQRQEEQNKKTEENLADMANKMAYLGMDTSGANALALIQQEEALKDKQEEYRNTLIDQGIQQLQDANEKAFEQRERQISIAERQLELYESSPEFQAEVTSLMTDAMADGGKLWELLEYQRDTMFPEEIAETRKLYDQMTSKADTYKNTEWASAINQAKTSSLNLEKLVEFQEEQIRQKTQAQANTLQQQGFSVMSADDFKTNGNATSGGTKYDSYEKYLNAFSEWGGLGHSDATKSEADTRYSDLISGGAEAYNSETGKGLMNRGQYYAKYSNDIADGKQVDSYEKYVQGEYNKAYDDYGLGKDDGQFPVHFKGWGSSDLDMYINDQGKEEGVYSKQVALGEEITDESIIGPLRAIMERGYGTPDQRAINNNYARGLYYKGKAYVYEGGKFYPLKAELNGQVFSSNFMDGTAEAPTEKGTLESTKTAIKNYAKAGEDKRKAGTRNTVQYKTGGLADFTGPAWLDGTPSKPEYILNAAQTERFFSLVDVLEGISTKQMDNKSTGDNYFDIEINVEKLENDYDVERVAEKIRSMIYEDATYRNVNAINHIR